MSQHTVQQLLSETEKRFSGLSSTARLDALILLEHATGRDRGWLLARQNEDISDSIPASMIDWYTKIVQRRADGEPLAYITGKKEFYGLELEVTPDVLIPRPESEVLVDFAVEHTPDNSALIDVGSGSGALSIAIAKHRPDLAVTATDISPAALIIAKNNAEKHCAKITLIEADLLNGVKDKYQTIIANLPYVPDGFKPEAQIELSHEPAIALYAGSDGLDLYRKLFKQLDDFKQPKILIIESDPRQHDKLIELAARHAWKLKDQRDFGLALVSE